MKKILTFLFILSSIFILSTSIDFGLGWSFGDSYQMLLGYSEDFFNITWIFNPLENFVHKIYLDALFLNINNFSISPTLFIYNTKSIDFPLIEGGIKASFNQNRYLISLSLTYPFNSNSYFLENSLYISFKYIVPPPDPRKKWKDDLFIIFDYAKQKLFVGLGLSEHF
ncbi:MULTISPECIES: hypothetical protein [unclassified Thermosipho (in: thermotogales)]|uniref:hypothetical protein n=1 Tax=unclassified Thermosipho (in: thermotogales) TaxID=2676525 RepID=UPI0009843B81|nr:MULTISPECIES: hypothetical protein [unclassified Thermosipho (in: thermotogales)]MBT1247458.1 hypothetical protein [Thermosipho sp. 1244]OOC46292.1 hypothetical protein XO09_07740 [Thermosipho sp. 1223]